MILESIIVYLSETPIGCFWVLRSWWRPRKTLAGIETPILRSTPAQSGPTFNGFGDKFAPKLDSSTQINGRKWLYVIVNGLETLLPHSTDL